MPPAEKNASKFIGRLSWPTVLSEKIIHFRWLTILCYVFFL